MSPIRRLILALMLLLLPLPVLAQAEQLLQLIDYIGADYGGAVAAGEVVDAGEYREMLDFAEGVREQIAALPASADRDALLTDADELVRLVRARAPHETVRAISAAMTQKLMRDYDIAGTPRKSPDLDLARSLYAARCAGCHGVEGRGDGPAGAGLEPAPTDFRDAARYRHRSLFGLFNTITRGVDGTAMPAFDNLSEHERWSLAFLVGGMAAPETSAPVAMPAWATLKALTTLTPQQVAEAHGDTGGQVMAALRRNPAPLFDRESALAFAREQLGNALQAYRTGDRDSAYRFAVDAYLEGFELVEQSLDAVDSALRLEIEQAMTRLRGDIRNAVSEDRLARDIAAIDARLARAESLLGSTSLSGTTAFASAFFILLREGLEAVLVVAALAAFLVKTGRRDGLRYLHIGWIGALAAGFLTWWASVSLIDISGASREITEGVAAITAAVVLLYVGFWLHDKTTAAKWRQFIDASVKKALDSGTLLALSGLSFIAVYREVFESILFYQALWVQADENGRVMTIAGLLVGTVVLAVLAILIVRFSSRLPLRQFFNATGALMLILAIVFAGKGIAALQEAGLLPATLIHFPRIELLGVYPNAQGVMVQTLLLLMAIWLWRRKSQ